MSFCRFFYTHTKKGQTSFRQFLFEMSTAQEREIIIAVMFITAYSWPIRRRNTADNHKMQYNMVILYTIKLNYLCGECRVEVCY